MNERLRIASEQMAALICLDMMGIGCAELAKLALNAADALKAEHERTRVATVGEALADLTNKTIAVQPLPPRHERTQPSQCQSSDPTDTFDCMLDAGHTGDHLSGNDLPWLQTQPPAPPSSDELLRELDDIVTNPLGASGYVVNRIKRAAARIRELEERCEHFRAMRNDACEERDQLRRRLASHTPSTGYMRAEAAEAELARLTTLRPVGDWTEADGRVLVYYGDGKPIVINSVDSSHGIGWTPLPKVKGDAS